MRAEVYPGSLRLVFTRRDLSKLSIAHQGGVYPSLETRAIIYDTCRKKNGTVLVLIGTCENLGRFVAVEERRDSETGERWYQASIDPSALSLVLERGVIADYRQGDRVFATLYRKDFLDTLK